MLSAGRRPHSVCRNGAPRGERGLLWELGCVSLFGGEPKEAGVYVILNL